MKKTIILFIIIMLMEFTGCTSANSDEVELLTNQLNDLSIKFDMYEDLNSEIESLSDRLQAIEIEVTELKDDNQSEEMNNKLNLISESVTDLEFELQFVEDTVYNRGLFKADEIDVGDYVGGMSLKEKDYHNDWRLLFSGEAELTGAYTISLNDEYWGSDVIFFDVNDESPNNVLPRALGDNRHLWFVVSNHDEAYDMLILNGLEGNATIVIDNYLIDLLQSDVVNEADLIRVIDFK